MIGSTVFAACFLLDELLASRRYYRYAKSGLRLWRLRRRTCWEWLPGDPGRFATTGLPFRLTCERWLWSPYPFRFIASGPDLDRIQVIVPWPRFAILLIPVLDGGFFAIGALVLTTYALLVQLWGLWFGAKAEPRGLGPPGIDARPGRAA